MAAINRQAMICIRQSIKEIGRAILVVQLFLWTGPLQAQRVHDTLRFARIPHHHVVLSDSALNAIGVDSLLSKIETIHFSLNRINSITAMGFDTRDIEHDFPGVDSSIDIISANLSLYTRVLDIKNLQLFDVMLSDIQQELNQWRASLFKYSKELARMDSELAAFRKDEVLRQLLVDTAFTNTYGDELKTMQLRRKQAEASVSAAILKINRLQAELSNEYFEALELQTQVKELLRKGGVKTQGKEYPYLWELVPASTAESREQDSLFRQSYIGQRRILTYYFMRNWDDQIWMLVVGILFILWIFRNYRKTEHAVSTADTPTFTPRYLSRIPVLPTFVLLLNLAPFFNLHPPTAYVAITQMFLIIVLTFLFRKHWPRRLYQYWLVIGGLYLMFSFAGILLTPGLTFRLLLVVINLISIVFGVVWLRNFRKYALNFSGMIRFVSLIYVVLNVAAVFCNLFGRLSLAKILSITGIFSLTQIVGLSVFIEVILEAFQLQTIVNQLRGGLAARMNFEKIRIPLRRILDLLSMFVWIMVFTISLNIYNVLVDRLTHVLTKSRKIGSATFEIGNILLFILILYVSHQLQRGLGSLYGKASESWDSGVRKNASRLAIMRLTLIVIGFLIAVAALGLPVDKIAIVLGALGVGIGLGLQAIVNNFVSGIILIFEQPFRIGDYIELGDKKGRVLDIGIRSSKLLMEEGAEVILPNADLLSGRVINWTIHNDNIRIELPLSIEPGHPFEEVSKTITEALKNNENVLKEAESDVLLTSINEKSLNLNVRVWINNVHREQLAKGELLNIIHEQLSQKGIKMI